MWRFFAICILLIVLTTKVMQSVGIGCVHLMGESIEICQQNSLGELMGSLYRRYWVSYMQENGSKIGYICLFKRVVEVNSHGLVWVREVEV
jgi:hypothetical protein